MSPSDSAAHNIVPILRQSVSAALTEHELCSKTLLVAVSGGPDSLALLHALCLLRDSHHLRLVGAHLNHKLRGAASDADAEFAAKEFERLCIPYTLRSADVATYRRKRRLSPEDAARRVRYAFLADAAAHHYADAIALGHTADDQAETVLMHIIHGSGITGLRGMQPFDHTNIDGKTFALFRPLLSVTRSQTQAYCRRLGLQPRIDASNLSPKFMRNRIRLELLPLLKHFNPSIHEALIRLADSATQDSDYIRAQVNDAWREAARLTQTAIGDVITLDTLALSRRHAAVRRYLLRRAVETVTTGAPHISQRNILDMMRLTAAPPGKSLHLPGDLLFRTGYGEAYIGQTAAIAAALPPLPVLRGEHLLPVPGDTRIGRWRITASITQNTPAQDNPKQEHTAYPANLSQFQVSETLDMDCVGEELRLRARLPGDRFQPLGMSHSKSLREFMVDARIPRRWRDGLPLLVSERGIVCVPGWRIAHWGRVNNATKRLLNLNLTYTDAQD